MELKRALLAGHRCSTAAWGPQRPATPDKITYFHQPGPLPRGGGGGQGFLSASEKRQLLLLSSQLALPFVGCEKQEGTSGNISFLPNPWLRLAVLPPRVETSQKREDPIFFFVFFPSRAPFPDCHPCGAGERAGLLPLCRAGGDREQRRGLPKPFLSSIAILNKLTPPQRIDGYVGLGLGGERAGRFTLP